ncbi:MAG: hypothetical protein CSA34_02135 [Desulfobulbus propionicus]|nr:MAG: hypothetical protein CSA34_02135 [Desulfobulbus propionicus]
MRFRSLLFLVYVAILLPCAGVPRAQESGEPQRLRIHIGKIRQEIALHQEKVDDADREERDLLSELQRIDESIGARLDKITQLEHQVLDQEILIRTKEHELEQAMAEGATVREHLQQRLRAFYLTGKVSFLNVTFSRRNLPELMIFHDAFSAMLNDNQKVIIHYRETAEKIRQSKQVHILEQVVQQKFLEQINEERQELELVRKEKEELLAKIRTRKGLYQQALKEMQKAETDLAATLLKLKEREERRLRGFLLNKGKLPKPVEGLLVHTFSGKDPGKANRISATDAGITIKTKDKAKVRAVYGGKVVFAGYMRGFGKMIVIDHGLQYYTVTARFEHLTVHEGEEVQQGQVLGSTGELATLFNDGLYFEIRHVDTSLDPLLWLQPGAYTATLSAGNPNDEP